MTTATGPGTPRATEGPTLRLLRWAELMLPTMTEIRDRRPLLQPLLLGWVLSLLTAWTTVPLVTEALGGDPDGVTGIVQGWMWAMAALSPLVQGGRALLWTAAAWALLTLSSREAPGRRLFSVFLYGEALIALHGLLLGLFFLWVADPGAAGSGFTDPLSLASYVPSDHGLWGGVVKQLGLLQALWVVYVGLACRRILGLESKGAWTLALALWFGPVAVETARMLMSG